MNSDERRALWLVPPITPPAGINHRKVKRADGVQLQVIPKIPFKVRDRLAASLGRHLIVFDFPIHGNAGRPIRVATEMHFEIAARRAGPDAEPKTARPSGFR